MLSERITLADLVTGLTEYRDLFGRFDVFADDIAELSDDEQARAGNGTKLRPVQGEHDTYLFEQQGGRFVLQVSPEGIVQIRYADGPVALDETRGPSFDAAIGAASSKKGRGWPKGLVLGMLAGRARSSISRLDRVLTVRFDETTRSWPAYDGGLVTWLKSELEPTG